MTQNVPGHRNPESLGLLNYYTMLVAGYFRQNPLESNGFESFSQRYKPGTTVPAGVVSTRSWKLLENITPEWRRHIGLRTNDDRLDDAMQRGELKPIVFSDVDLAVMNRDAQGHVDQYVADRATLEALGFVAMFYDELTNPNLHLSEIRGSASYDACFELGQQMFHTSLQKMRNMSNARIPLNRVDDFMGLAMKSPDELTDDDYQEALSYIDDAFYELIINPLAEYISLTPGHSMAHADSHAGTNRMKLIYTTIAAYSHAHLADNEKVRHKLFGDFNAREHLFEGVEQFFNEFRSRGIDVVAITRGNQFPYMDSSTSGINDLFTRVYSTMVASSRSQPYLDPIHPDKKIRSYSMAIDNMSTTDKVRIMIHESLDQFARAGFHFSSDQELINALGQYLDHCIFITDSDLEVWGTAPIVAVLARRTPTAQDVANTFENLVSRPKPSAIINPTGVSVGLHGLNEADVFENFDPQQPGLRMLIQDVATGADIRIVYSAVEGLTR
jgi:hypothetical protein